MDTVIVDKPGYIKVSYVEKKKYILFGWTNFTVTLADIKEIHEKALDFAKTVNCNHYVADTSTVKSVLIPEVVEWFGKVWVPKLAAYGLKSIVTVIPASAVATLSTVRWQNEVIGISMANVASILDAEKLLESLP